MKYGNIRLRQHIQGRQLLPIFIDSFLNFRENIKKKCDKYYMLKSILCHLEIIYILEEVCNSSLKNTICFNE